MKNLVLTMTVLFSANLLAADTSLICNDQNSHAVYKLTLTQDLQKLQLTTLIGDSSVLAAGTKQLKFQEGETVEDSALYVGKTNSALNVAVHLDAKRAASLKKYEILEIFVQYQAERSANLALSTTFLCSIN